MRDHHFLLRLFLLVVIPASLFVATAASGAPPRPLTASNELVASGSNAEFPSNLQNPRVARDADGDYVVVWHGRGADSSDIFARLFKRDGKPRGSAFEINQFTTGNQEAPDVAMDASGDFVVVWESANQDGDSSGIYARLYRAGGIPFGDEFRVNITTASHQRDPAVAIDAAGESIAVVYESFAVGDNKGEVFLRRLSSEGVGLGGEVRVNEFVLDFQNHPDVAMAPAGSFVVAWESEDQNSSGDHIYYRKFNANGSAAGVEVEANPGTSFQGSARVAANANGDFLVVWSDNDQSGTRSETGIFARDVPRSSTGSAGTTFEVRARTVNFLSSPVVSGSAGGFVVSWPEREVSSIQDRVLARRIFPSDLSSLPVFVLKDVTVATSPDVAADADGDFVVVVEGFRTGRSQTDILGRRFGVAEVDLAAALSLDVKESGSLTPGSTVVYRARVDHLTEPASVDSSITRVYRDAIGVADGVRLTGQVLGDPKNPVLGRVGGSGLKCEKKSKTSYECERDPLLRVTDTSPRIEIEVDAPKEPSTLKHIVNVKSDQVDPVPGNNRVVLTTQIACKLRLSQTRFCVTESVGSRTIAVERVGRKCPSASVTYSARQDSALVGFDFVRTEGSLSWAADDQQPKIVTVPILNDTSKESAELFDVKLSKPVGTKIDGPDKAQVRIVDDDPLPAGGCNP